MDTAVVQQFLNFFQNYIELCQADNWPDNDTSELELRNAFLISQHVEKCLDKLQKQGVINEFISVLNSNESTSNSMFKYCLSHPPRYILKKIINSNTNIKQMDVGFKLFLELFSEEKLENCLTDFMLEAASKETLLRNLPSEVPKDTLIKFKSDVLLSQLSCSNSNILDLFKNYDQNIVELLVVSLLNTEPSNTATVKLIADTFLSVVVSKDNIYKDFWRHLFKVDEKYLIEMCLENADIFTCIVEAVSDCGKLLREAMSSELFYIDLDKTELKNVVKLICKNNCLKSQFFVIIEHYDFDVDFWHKLL